MQPLTKFLKSAERTSHLSREQRLRIVEQALLLIEMNYVHLPLKQAMHAVNPIQLLKLLKFRLACDRRAEGRGIRRKEPKRGYPAGWVPIDVPGRRSGTA